MECGEEWLAACVSDSPSHLSALPRSSLSTTSGRLKRDGPSVSTRSRQPLFLVCLKLCHVSFHFLFFVFHHVLRPAHTACRPPDARRHGPAPTLAHLQTNWLDLYIACCTTCMFRIPAASLVPPPPSAIGVESRLGYLSNLDLDLDRVLSGEEHFSSASGTHRLDLDAKNADRPRRPT
ncbi:hypothetical protein IWZ01DRAFT_70337 [Phyllosticta capitalensis]